MTGFGLPKYRGRRNRCDYCETLFRKGDIIARSILEESEYFLCGFILTIEPECLRRMCLEKEVLEKSFKMMEFQGKEGGNAGESNALLFG